MSILAPVLAPVLVPVLDQKLGSTLPWEAGGGSPPHDVITDNLITEEGANLISEEGDLLIAES